MKQSTRSLLLLGVLLSAFAVSQYFLWTRVPDWETAHDLLSALMNYPIDLISTLMNHLMWFNLVCVYAAKDYLRFLFLMTLILGTLASVVACLSLMDRMKKKPQPTPSSPNEPRYNLRPKRQKKFVVVAATDNGGF